MDNLLKIIHELGKHLNDEISIRKLAIDSEIPYTSTRRTIEENKKLFSIQKKGQAKFITLNKENDIVKHYLIISERYASEKIFKTQKFLNIIKDDIKKGKYALILFGSRAENKHRENSDVDLFIINKKGEKNITFKYLELLANKEINPMYVTEKEFIEMINNDEHNVVKEILNKHILFKGEEYYWNIVWENAIRKKRIRKGV